jgi:Cys-rich repeat protein
MRPVARKDNLTIREMPDETLVYDLERHKLHCLNRTSALVWRHCDGLHDPDSLAAMLTDTFGLEPEQARAAARLALEQLGRRGLLLESVAPPTEKERLTRRSALRRLAVAAAAALPVVMSLGSRAYGFGVQPCRNDSDCPAGQVCSGANPNLSGEGMGTCVGASSAPAAVVTPVVSIILSCSRICNYDAFGTIAKAATGTPCVNGQACNAVCPRTGKPNTSVLVSGSCV